MQATRPLIERCFRTLANLKKTAPFIVIMGIFLSTFLHDLLREGACNFHKNIEHFLEATSDIFQS
jgi:hypothetical protein